MAIILPYTGLPQSRFVAEKVFQLISNTTFKDPESTKSYKQTVSLGYASILPNQSNIKDNKLIPLALDALIRSKGKGGNRVEQAVV